ncbi:MAG: type II toxin-antitoxin system prevent-host-death family antitoxin [Bacteroidetes bacterium]|nr:type II toxin-antitoxin system prevent-host-death family antitoxin [Bacteroidota bacterium]
MRAVNYSELRRNLKTSLDAVSNDDELLVVHRPKGKSIVMMPLDEYNSLQETYHLNRSKTNRQRLEASIENINGKHNLLKRSIIE